MKVEFWDIIDIENILLFQTKRVQLDKYTYLFIYVSWDK